MKISPLAVVLLPLLLDDAVAFSGGREVIRVPKTSPGWVAKSTVLFPPNSSSNRDTSLSLFHAESNHQDNPLVNNRYSASDWIHNMRSLPRSSVLRDILNPVMSVVAWGTFVSVAQRMMAMSNQECFQMLSRNMCISATAHGFLVSALGLLLVFRTNSAYQRFYEGRKIWENILSISRNLSRMMQLYSREVGSDRKRRILHLVAAFPYLLRHHIRPGCLCEGESAADLDPDYSLCLHEPAARVVDTRYEGDKSSGGITQPHAVNPSSTRQCWVDRRNLPWRLFESSSLKKIAKAQNRPMWVCDRIGREIMSIPYGPNFTSRERLSLLSQVEKLCNAVGQCERIHQTAVPLNYARHSLRSLTIWLFTLPFALIKDMGMMTGPVMGIISWLMFGVYQIGYSIEDPFQGSLRLTILCDAIRRDVIGETEERETAFSLEDTWELEEALEGSAIGSGSSNTASRASLPKPIVTKAPDEAANLLWSAPQIVKENGTWNVVGMVEG